MRTIGKYFQGFRQGFTLLLIILFLSCAVFFPASATQERHYLGTTVNTGHDTGFSESHKITEDDPHFGWELGSFYVDGYTRVTEGSFGDPVFLKTVGDTVALWFELNQDITKLNGDEMLSICGDPDGYDEYFRVEKTDMGRGALIIRHTDYQNFTSEPVIYTDYLAATATQDAAIEVKLCEEGDYEVALNYEIREDNVDIFGWNPFPSYYNYRIYFRFSVRNGNCMVYPFDAATGAELLNSSITENGFYLDLANSRYLNIDIKKEIRREGAEGLVEDVRFNKPAKDGEKYTEEGIYTITVSNIYTDQTTTKVIYVGTDDVLKAHVATGMSISDVERHLAAGATVAEDGSIIPLSEPIILPTENNPAGDAPSTPSDDAEEQPSSMSIWVFIAVGVVLVVAALTIFIVLKKRHSKHNTVVDNSEEDQEGTAL